MLLLSPDRDYDVVNRVSVEGLFLSEWFAWEDPLLGSLGSRPAAAPPSILSMPPQSEFLSSFRAASSAVALPAIVPDDVALNRAMELLLWIRSLTGYLPPLASEHLPHRLLRLLQKDPARNWSSDLVAREIGMSEATMRRRLAEFDTTFSSVLRNCRMTRAMQLLQSTSMSVTQVAFEVGYESPARFAARFRQRFGYSPGSVRSPRTDGHRLEAAE